MCLFVCVFVVCVVGLGRGYRCGGCVMGDWVLDRVVGIG